MPGRTGIDGAGRQPRPSMLRKSGNCIVPSWPLEPKSQNAPGDISSDLGLGRGLPWAAVGCHSPRLSCRSRDGNRAVDRLPSRYRKRGTD